jgi:hypothetical protein
MLGNTMEHFVTELDESTDDKEMKAANDTSPGDPSTV